MQAEVIQGTLEQPLTAHDRCDGCGAQAYVRVTMSWGELLFCLHHWQEPGTQDKLKPTAMSIHDETQKLLSQEGVQPQETVVR